MEPIHHELVRAGHPEQWLLFLHGILGSGANWRSLARKVIAARPTWGAVLVDLRGHGRSHALGAPFTLDQVADDLASLPVPIAAVLGHSFGGKVALVMAQREPLEHLILVDSNPGPRPDGRGSEATTAVLEVLRGLPPTFPDRDAFVAALEAAGQPLFIAQWLAMNLVREGEALRFGPDLDGVAAFLQDYFARDLWSVLEAGATPTDAIVGSTSPVVDEAARAQLAHCTSVKLHVVEGAGHWVHVDAPDEVERIVCDALGWLA